jgi:hypothetical protein
MYLSKRDIVLRATWFKSDPSAKSSARTIRLLLILAASAILWLNVQDSATNFHQGMTRRKFDQFEINVTMLTYAIRKGWLFYLLTGVSQKRIGWFFIKNHVVEIRYRIRFD